ncbi:VanZ family protein [Thalassospira sp. MA62]|nr:VanZ family protein [Thalassospira sp. MA62]
MHWLRYLAMTGFWGLILLVGYLSLLPAQKLPDVQLWDKLQHFIAYGAIAFAGRIAYPRHVTWVLVGTVCYGIGIEFAQGQVAGRDPSFEDAIANALGAMLAILVARLPFVRRMIALTTT